MKRKPLYYHSIITKQIGRVIIHKKLVANQKQIIHNCNSLFNLSHWTYKFHFHSHTYILIARLHICAMNLPPFFFAAASAAANTAADTNDDDACAFNSNFIHLYGTCECGTYHSTHQTLLWHFLFFFLSNLFLLNSAYTNTYIGIVKLFFFSIFCFY